MADDALAGLSDEAAATVLRLLDRYRRELLGLLAGSEGGLTLRYRQLLREAEALAQAVTGQMALPLRDAVERAAALGDATALADLRLSRVDARSYVGVNPTLVRVAGEYVAKLTEDLMADVLQRISMHIRLAALGGMPFTTLLDRIGRDMTSGAWKPARSRVETIAQTEVSRLYNLAYYDQAVELASRVEGMRKRWVHASSSPGFTAVQRQRSRPHHIAVARRTQKKPIPMDEVFNLGRGIRARFPHDPALPATETNRCRCRLELVPPDAQATE
jgi:hypothetical protein